LRPLLNLRVLFGFALPFFIISNSFLEYSITINYNDSVCEVLTIKKNITINDVLVTYRINDEVCENITCQGFCCDGYAFDFFTSAAECPYSVDYWRHIERFKTLIPDQSDTNLIHFTPGSLHVLSNGKLIPFDVRDILRKVRFYDRIGIISKSVHGSRKKSGDHVLTTDTEAAECCKRNTIIEILLNSRNELNHRIVKEGQICHHR
jgi:hypothetical protein